MQLYSFPYLEMWTIKGELDPLLHTSHAMPHPVKEVYSPEQTTRCNDLIANSIVNIHNAQK